MNAEDLSLLSLKQKPDFVETPAVRSLTARASSYLCAAIRSISADRPARERPPCNRSRPEANNVLLAILEERLLEMPSGRVNEGYTCVHPNFRAIFTSNPEEYAGVHKTQDALLDRMITDPAAAQGNRGQGRPPDETCSGCGTSAGTGLRDNTGLLRRTQDSRGNADQQSFQDQ